MKAALFKGYAPPPRPTIAPMADWLAPVAPLRPDSTCGEAYRIFMTDPEIQALAVVNDGIPVGLVGRGELLACLSDRFAPSHAESDPVTKIMNAAPLTVDLSCDFERLVRMMSDERPETLFSGFVVTRDGHYVGVGTARSLLRASEKRIADHSREMRRKEIEASESTKSKAQFLAAVSHELRTPLNAIIGFSQIIAEGTFGEQDFERYRGYAQDIQNSGQHLLEVINDILDISKIEAGKLELREETMDVAGLVDSTLRLIRQRATEGHIRLQTDIPDCDCRIRGDKRLLRQMLLNLVANAVKFTPPGGRVTVRVSRDRDDSLLFVVADTGIGIAKEDIPKAMTPFGQVDNSLGRKYGGSGLGLPLAKAMAEAHGGSLVLQSEPGCGTTVTVRIPAERVAGIGCAPAKADS